MAKRARKLGTTTDMKQKFTKCDTCAREDALCMTISTKEALQVVAACPACRKKWPEPIGG